MGVGNGDCDPNFSARGSSCVANLGAAGDGGCEADFGVVFSGCLGANFGTGSDASFDVGNDCCNPDFGVGNSDCVATFGVGDSGCDAGFGVGNGGCDLDLGGCCSWGDCLANFGADRGKWGTAKEILKIMEMRIVVTMSLEASIILFLKFMYNYFLLVFLPNMQMSIYMYNYFVSFLHRLYPFILMTND